MAASTAAGKQRIPKVAKVGDSGGALWGGPGERGSPRAPWYVRRESVVRVCRPTPCGASGEKEGKRRAVVGCKRLSSEAQPAGRVEERRGFVQQREQPGRALGTEELHRCWRGAALRWDTRVKLPPCLMLRRQSRMCQGLTGAVGGGPQSQRC